MGNGQSLYLPNPFLLKKQFCIANVYDTSLFTETNLHYRQASAVIVFLEIHLSNRTLKSNQKSHHKDIQAQRMAKSGRGLLACLQHKALGPFRSSLCRKMIEYKHELIPSHHHTVI
jgi:hypothetical protein